MTKALATPGKTITTAPPAAVPPADPATDPTPEAVTAAGGAMTAVCWLVPEGVRSPDRRMFAPGSLTLGALPLPFMYLPETSFGHQGAEVAGKITGATLHDNGMWQATIEYSDTDQGKAAFAAMEDQSCRFISADVYGVESQVILIETLDDWGEPELQDYYELFTQGEIRGGTQVPFPAFSECVVAPTADDLPTPTMESSGTLVASAADAPERPEQPPAEWFTDPGFALGDQRLVQDIKRRWGCPLTVMDNGEVFGHIALWGTDHIAYQGKSLRPPKSPSQYAYFRTGAVKCDDGTTVAVGQLTMGCGHPDESRGILNARQAQAHYDGGPGAVQVCSVAAGEDEFGIWVHGWLNPDITAEQVAQFRSLAPSGDWRQIGGSLELVAVVQVPVPGFPVPRQLTASALEAAAMEGANPSAGFHEGEMVSLVAAGRFSVSPVEAQVHFLAAQVATLSAAVRPMLLERLK